jgi:hypothetical protein
LAHLTQKDIDYIDSNFKWPLQYDDIWNRYMVMLFPAFLLFLGLIIPIEIGLTKFSATWAILLLGFAVYFIIYHSKRIEAERKFYSIAVTSFQLTNIEEYLKQLKWTILEKNSSYISARTPTSLTSWGENITILFRENELLFNSRPDAQPNTYNRDCVNFEALYNLLNNDAKQLTDRL